MRGGRRAETATGTPRARRRSPYSRGSCPRRTPASARRWDERPRIRSVRGRCAIGEGASRRGEREQRQRGRVANALRRCRRRPRTSRCRRARRSLLLAPALPCAPSPSCSPSASRPRPCPRAPSPSRPRPRAHALAYASPPRLASTPRLLSARILSHTAHALAISPASPANTVDRRSASASMPTATHPSAPVPVFRHCGRCAGSYPPPNSVQCEREQAALRSSPHLLLLALSRRGYL